MMMRRSRTTRSTRKATRPNFHDLFPCEGEYTRTIRDAFFPKRPEATRPEALTDKSFQRSCQKNHVESLATRIKTLSQLGQTIGEQLGLSPDDAKRLGVSLRNALALNDMGLSHVAASSELRSRLDQCARFDEFLVFRMFTNVAIVLGPLLASVGLHPRYSRALEAVLETSWSTKKTPLATLVEPLAGEQDRLPSWLHDQLCEKDPCRSQPDGSSRDPVCVQKFGKWLRRESRPSVDAVKQLFLSCVPENFTTSYEGLVGLEELVGLHPREVERLWWVMNGLDELSRRVMFLVKPDSKNEENRDILSWFPRYVRIVHEICQGRERSELVEISRQGLVWSDFHAAVFPLEVGAHVTSEVLLAALCSQEVDSHRRLWMTQVMSSLDTVLTWSEEEAP